MHPSSVLSAGVVAIYNDRPLTNPGLSELRWLLKDHLGSTETVLNHSYAVLDRRTHNAWGEPDAWQRTDDETGDRSFTGHHGARQRGEGASPERKRAGETVPAPVSSGRTGEQMLWTFELVHMTKRGSA